SLVDQALETAPSSFRVYDRSGENPAVLEKDNIHFAPGSVALNILDSDTEEIRKPKIPDLIRITRLIETLENVQFQTGPIVPEDIPVEIQDVFRFLLILAHSEKPIFGGAFTAEGLRLQKDLLALLRGGEAELAERPRAIFAANPTAPLMWGGIIAQNLADCARFGIPVMLIPMPLPGGNAPVTLAGTLAEHTAENLSGIVISQLVNPGSPVLYGGGAIVLDMRYGTSCIGAVETLLLGSGYSQIGKALGLPTASNIGQSDAKRVDAQAGLESGSGIMIAALSGINLSRGPGMMAFANCQSYEKLVVDNNICGMALRFVKGIECSPETIALDIIKQAGRSAKGHMSSDHTLEWFKKEVFFPTASVDRLARREGEKGTRAWDRAKEEVTDRLDAYDPDPLPRDLLDEMTEMVRVYARGKGLDGLPEIPTPEP
ncbi:MAG: trimethylamine methyltransferase family protein, partial [Deltaproteobacteria bacterium]|nr:trimethylamine methyltransferase family protein [Deltaproteobacteria bacterium]